MSVLTLSESRTHVDPFGAAGPNEADRAVLVGFDSVIAEFGVLAKECAFFSKRRRSRLMQSYTDTKS